MTKKSIETMGMIINGFSIALLFYLLFTLEVSDLFYPLWYLGWLLLVSGIGLVFMSIVALTRNKSSGLIVHGIYGIIRHPMYLGAMLCFLSFFFFNPQWLMLVISSINITIIYWFILHGEEQNIARFGDAYRHYMDIVPRINMLLGILRRIRRV